MLGVNSVLSAGISSNPSDKSLYFMPTCAAPGLWVHAEERVDAQQQGHACYDGQGQQVPCCAWQPAPWVPPYMSLASITLLWTVFLCGQIRKYVISSTIAQWCGCSPLSSCSPSPG